MSFNFKEVLVLITVMLHPFLFHFACKAIPLQKIGPGFILGDNNIIATKEDWDDIGIRKVIRATVLIATHLENGEKVLCSGVLIKAKENTLNYRVVTNHHCFHKKDPAGQVTTQLLKGACTNTKVYVGFNENEAGKTRVSNCMPGTLRHQLIGDLAWFELAPMDVSSDIALDLVVAEPKLNEELLVVHYPILEKRFSVMTGTDFQFPQASITKEDCTYVGPFSLMEKRQDASLIFALQHTCDLEFGSSGSGVWSKDGSKFYGLNWGGIQIESKQNFKRINVATTSAFVEAFLNGNSEEILAQSGAALVEDPSHSSDASPTSASREDSVKRDRKSNSCGVIP